ncbi:MAG: trimethylamine methyltransferase family protein [Rhizobiaceae bacterium]
MAPTDQQGETAETPGSVRRGRRSRAQGDGEAQPRLLAEGGSYNPLTPDAVGRIQQAMLDILARVGMAGAPRYVVETITAAGGTVSDDGRLLYSTALVQRAMQEMPRSLVLHGQKPGLELRLEGARVHTGTGGASPNVIDLASGRYRPSSLGDLHAAALLADQLAHVHFFSRSVVARDMPDDLALDINTAFASLAGTAKHVSTSISSPDHVQMVARICYLIAGGETAFRERPFLSLNVNHSVPPLRFSTDACGVLREAARFGIPVHLNTFGQLGASSPVTIAGSVAQTLAETMAGMIYVWLINPELPAIFGPRPMVTDLRTGAMAGGSGEQALLTAACVQMARSFSLPNSTIAGATDSKLADAQAGYEKALNVGLAAQAGANMITQACGVQAGLMALAYDAMIIDNEMLGSILRSLGPVDLDPAALDTGMILETVRGEGHFLGHPETHKRMKSDFLYPQLADRRSFAEWEADGSRDIRENAAARARQMIDSHKPDHMPKLVERDIRAAFDIRLPENEARTP